MSQDVEIIDVDENIIEISDEEDSKVILILDNDVEYHDTKGNEISSAKRTQYVNNTSSKICFPSTSRAAESVAKNGCGNEVKLENDINNDSLPPINNIVSQLIKSENSQRNKRRGKQILRGISNQMESIHSGNNNKKVDFNSSNFMRPIRSTSNKNSTAEYDFSRLKWLQPLSNLSSPPHLQMVIIDRSHPFWRIDKEKWIMIEKRLLEALNAEMIYTNDPSIGLFDGAKWQRGIKIVGCHNENAFNFIKKFVIKLDKLWNGARLDAFPITNINRHIVKAYIPPPNIKTDIIMSLIKLQNPTVYGNDWRVVKERERTTTGGVDIWISINEESFMQLSNLRGEIKFGINRIFLNPSS